ncbi:MAG TPA: methyltransferase domain-containing protein [Polyangiaceae bacterium]|nr:methyltransferase domain-containing protein [Polyangiaceae bacterium]
MTRHAFEDPELGSVTRDQLTRDVWVLQRRRGHRFSSDDLITAFVAWHATPHAQRVLDLGCGLGSVLLQLAWKLPSARLVGVEAQEVSYSLLLRNIAHSGFSARISAHRGDLRHSSTLAGLGSGFDLITATPPYFPAHAALTSVDEQRSFARIEYRGGVEDYVTSAAPLLGGDGVLVVCVDARAAKRLTQAALCTGLHPRARCDVIARAGRAPLFSVWSLRAQPGPELASSFVLRNEHGERTLDAERLREFAGL